MIKLTAKQEGFVQDVATGSTLADAYRNNYDAENMADKTIWEAASRLMADSKATARLSFYQQQAAERTLVTIQSISDELDEAREVAVRLDQSTAMTTATMGKAKVNGLLIEKTEAKVDVTHDLDAATETLSALLSSRDARK